MKRKLKKNKGLSLIELLVAIAISSIVMLMVTSVILTCNNTYGKEKIKAGLLNDAQMVMSKVSDTIMEATYLEGNSSLTYLETAEVNVGAFKEKAGKTIYYDNSDGSLYVSSKPYSVMSGADKKPYLVSDYVKAFSVSINDSCKERDDAGNYVLDVNGNPKLANPIKLDVSITFERRKEEVTVDQSIVVRNKLSSIKFGGISYTVE